MTHFFISMMGLINMKNISIITGSTLGNAEYVGDHLAEQLEQMEMGSTVYIHNQPDLIEIDLTSFLLFIVSTHGAGDYPNNIKPFIEQINSIDSLPETKYAIIAIGDSSYDTFCKAGFSLNTLLKNKNANELWPLLTIDVTLNPTPEDPAEMWLKKHICN